MTTIATPIPTNIFVLTNSYFYQRDWGHEYQVLFFLFGDGSMYFNVVHHPRGGVEHWLTQTSGLLDFLPPALHGEMPDDGTADPDQCRRIWRFLSDSVGRESPWTRNYYLESEWLRRHRQDLVGAPAVAATWSPS